MLGLPSCTTCSSSTIVSDSLSSIPEYSESESPSLAPSSPRREATDCSSEVDFNSKSYIAELLENGLKEERFRIDRKKLEDMLQMEQSQYANTENAEAFFQKVMAETSTQISWPSKLKIGAKSKKDPHVKIIGKPEAVQLAKERILEILDTKKNRVTLKMDVSHSAHSYIIGKGGFKIQQVMEETGCHIHFPDSNRNTTAEKSNQVSIAGQAAGVEQARAKIRELLPLVFIFELANGVNIKPGAETTPDLQHIQQTYSFNVAFRPQGVGRTLLEVRGSQRLLPRMRQGLSFLMEYLTGSKTIPVLGFMQTEIAAQHHQFVQGPGNINVQMIQNKTGASIIFPDPATAFFGAESPQAISLIPGHTVQRSKSTVLIHGSFDSVCLAWQELLKCLPLVLMFDLKEGQELDPVMVNNFMEAFNINIMLRPKVKENTKSVLIRGAEKESRILFQVRKDILVLEEEECPPPSPSLYSAHTLPTIETYRQSPTLREQKTAALTTAESLNILSSIIQRNPSIVGLLNNLSNALPPNVPEVTPQPTPNAAYRSVMQNYTQHQQVSPNHLNRNVESWINRPDRSYAYASVTNYLLKDRHIPIDDGDSGVFMPSNSSRSFTGLSSKSEVPSRHESSASSTSSNDTDFKSNRFFHKEHQSLGDEQQLLSDYGSKKLGASAAMNQHVEGPRTPNLLWAGFGFSKSMPDCNTKFSVSSPSAGSISEYLEAEGASATSDATSAVWNDDKTDKNSPLEPTSPFALSNFWENIPRRPPVNYSSIQTLEQLLSHLNLEQYYEIFAQQEIDLPTFLTLTEVDLKLLDINYGVRRKMLIAISALRGQRMGDWAKHFHAAPGAERRALLSRFPCSSVTDDTSEQ